MRIATLVAAPLLALGLAGAPANAAIINVNSDFAANGFGPGAPVDPVTGTFSVTFDNSSSILNSVSGVTASLNIPVDVIGFNYDPDFDILNVGGLFGGVDRILFSTNDFVLIVTGVSTAPAFGGFSYTQTSETTFFSTESGSLTPAAVPEPFSLTLLGAALACLAIICGPHRATRA